MIIIIKKIVEFFKTKNSDKIKWEEFVFNGKTYWRIKQKKQRW